MVSSSKWHGAYGLMWEKETYIGGVTDHVAGRSQVGIFL